MFNRRLRSSSGEGDVENGKASRQDIPSPLSPLPRERGTGFISGFTVRSGLVGTLLAVIGATASPVLAQAEIESPTAAQEKQAIEFARRHHPELAGLLNRLKESNRSAYKRAVTDVYQANERLSKLERNDEERFQVAMRIWTLDSRIRLLVARSTMSDDPGIEDQVRRLLRERQQVRLNLLRLDRRRTLARLERLDSQIEQIENDPAAAIENDLARIKREMKASASRERRSARTRSDRESPNAARPKKRPADE